MVEHDSRQAYLIWLQDWDFNAAYLTFETAFRAGWDAHKEEMNQEAMARD